MSLIERLKLGSELKFVVGYNKTNKSQ